MAAANDELVFYPAFCFKASPTHFTWVKMAAVDVHRLEKRRGFEGQNTYFYNNHPIRFIAVVGIIVARTEIPTRTILTVDDSSGATIEVVVLKSKPPAAPSAPPSLQSSSAVATEGTNNQPSHISFTTAAPLDIAHLVPGTLLKAKGTVSTFRSTAQLQLERFTLVPDTNAEMRFVDQRLRYLVDVLNVPWVLSEQEIAQLRVEADEEEEKIEEERRMVQERQRKRVKREERIQKEIQRRWEKEEELRELEARKCRDAGRKVMAEIETRRRRRKEDH